MFSVLLRDWGAEKNPFVYIEWGTKFCWEAWFWLLLKLLFDTLPIQKWLWWTRHFNGTSNFTLPELVVKMHKLEIGNLMKNSSHPGGVEKRRRKMILVITKFLRLMIIKWHVFEFFRQSWHHAQVLFSILGSASVWIWGDSEKFLQGHLFHSNFPRFGSALLKWQTNAIFAWQLHAVLIALPKPKIRSVTNWFCANLRISKDDLCWACQIESMKTFPFCSFDLWSFQDVFEWIAEAQTCGLFLGDEFREGICMPV